MGLDIGTLEQILKEAREGMLVVEVVEDTPEVLILRVSEVPS